MIIKSIFDGWNVSIIKIYLSIKTSLLDSSGLASKLILVSKYNQIKLHTYEQKNNDLYKSNQILKPCEKNEF